MEKEKIKTCRIPGDLREYGVSVGFNRMPYYLVTVAVSYMVSGYQSLYHKQKILFSKTTTSFIPKA